MSESNLYLQAVAALSLLPDNIEHTVDQLCTLGVVSLKDGN